MAVFLHRYHLRLHWRWYLIALSKIYFALMMIVSPLDGHSLMSLVILILILFRNMMRRVSCLLPDYLLKSQVIESGLVKKVKNLKRQMYIASLGSDPDHVLDHLNYELLFLESEDPVAFKEALRVAQNDFDRNTRLKHRIEFLLSLGECTFLTLTFTDDCLAATTSFTRKRYVVRYVKSQSIHYVGNIDFGEKNHREHYHVIIVGRADLSLWKHGAINAKHIVDSSNPLKMAKYISKLVNHAVKETCKRSAIIYSRSSFDDRELQRGKALSVFPSYFETLEADRLS